MRSGAGAIRAASLLLGLQYLWAFRLLGLITFSALRVDPDLYRATPQFFSG